MSASLVVAHLYPDLLRTYGDRGNVLALARRAEWRGFEVRVDEVSRGEPIARDTSIVVIGGGSDRAQEIIGPDLLSRRAELSDALAGGALVVGICGGYQLLGHEYVAADGARIEGLGLLDIRTVAGRGRIIGRVHARASLFGATFELFGFENHGGRTRLGAGATPLAAAPRGQGNNGKDHTEGATQDGLVGTYLHGPVLPSNPAFADAILERALAPVNGGAPLQPLDDRFEELAHHEARRRRR